MAGMASMVSSRQPWVVDATPVKLKGGRHGGSVHDRS